MVKQSHTNLIDSREYEKQLHENAAEDYEKAVKEWTLEHEYFIAGKWGRLFKGLFLDYGCGTGLVGRYLVRCGREVVGIDISRKMCKIAKTYSLQVVVGDCLNLPFRNQVFDVICCSGILHHLPNQLNKAFAEISRCVKQAICIIEPAATRPPFVVRLIRFIHKGFEWISNKLYKKYAHGKYTYSIFERPLNPYALKHLCQTSGFNIHTIQFFNHIPSINFLPISVRKHLIQSLLSSTNGTDVEIIAIRS